MSEGKTEVVLDPKRGLVIKLCEVMAAVGYLQKKGDNRAQEYKYIREADVVAKVRDEFAKRNLFIFPTMLHCERSKLSRIKYDKVSENYATDIVMRWTIVDGDTKEERFSDIPGCSESPGDKGVYVAMTGSEKYFLMKSLLLPTGDDPEATENEPTGSKQEAQETGQKKIEALKTKLGKKDATGLMAALPSLFYCMTESGYYEILGDEGYKSANRDLLKPFWSPNAKAILVDGAQLEDLKYTLGERKVPFHLLKEPSKQ